MQKPIMSKFTTEIEVNDESKLLIGVWTWVVVGVYLMTALN